MIEELVETVLQRIETNKRTGVAMSIELTNGLDEDESRKLYSCGRCGAGGFGAG